MSKDEKGRWQEWVCKRIFRSHAQLTALPLGCNQCRQPLCNLYFCSINCQKRYEVALWNFISPPFDCIHISESPPPHSLSLSLFSTMPAYLSSRGWARCQPKVYADNRKSAWCQPQTGFYLGSLPLNYKQQACRANCAKNIRVPLHFFLKKILYLGPMKCQTEGFRKCCLPESSLLLGLVIFFLKKILKCSRYYKNKVDRKLWTFILHLNRLWIFFSFSKGRVWSYNPTVWQRNYLSFTSK